EDIAHVRSRLFHQQARPGRAGEHRRDGDVQRLCVDASVRHDGRAGSCGDSERGAGMIRKDDNDPLGQIGSRIEEELERAASKVESGRTRAASRLDREIERLRTSPTPTTASSSRDSSTNGFVSGVPWMGIFSRTRDIIAANFNELLDQADDPAKMIRMIILEMEETLVEVRASAARTIADQKEMHRHCVK